MQPFFLQVWPSRVATCQSFIGCWGTRMVFLMANHRSTRVQGICKKLQTVRDILGGIERGSFGELREATGERIFLEGIPGA